MISKTTQKISVLLFTTLSPFAVLHANTAFDSFYAGVGLGESLTTAKMNSSTSAFAIESTTPASVSGRSALSQNLKKDSWLGAIYGGYGYSCDPYYLGAELFVKFTNRHASNFSTLNDATDSPDADTITNINENPTLTFRTVEFALDARPGILLSACSLLYGRIGIAFNKYSFDPLLQTTLVDTINFGTPTDGAGIGQPTSKKLGLRLGLGMEQMFCECISLRLDYIYTRYRRINTNFNLSSTVDTTTKTLTDSRNIKPVNHTFMLGLSYYW